MARRSDRKSTTNSKSTDLSRRSFIERVVGSSVTAPALMTLTGSWLMADTVAAQAQSNSSATRPSVVSSSGSESGGVPSIVPSTADSTLRHDSPNTNEGANPMIRVGVRPLRRGLVQFEPAIVAEMRAEAMNYGTVYLTLQIAANGNNWNQDDEHFVDVHPLPMDFWVNEGNGRSTGLPAGEIYLGDGAGVTWNYANDINTSDSKKTKAKRVQQQNWDGGSVLMGQPTAPGVLHENGLTGQVSWDVTTDVLNGANAWIIKVRDEEEPAQTPERRRMGFDPFRGSVDYYSKEGADLSSCTFPPQLQLVSFNYCNGESSSDGGQQASTSSSQEIK